MKILTEFDSGSVDVIDTSDIDNVQLAITADNKHSTTQWFHFRCITEAGRRHTIRLANAGQSTFSRAWKGYRVMASYDQQHWFRVETEFESGQLVITHTPEQSAVSYAYFTPYCMERQKKLNSLVSAHKLSSHKVLTHTPRGNPLDLLVIGQPGEGKKAIWLIARQHPGETMAQWFAEGMVKTLLGPSIEAEKLLEQAVFYLVPNMNPDGSLLGNHRTNAHGFNLNREWGSPSKVYCPEVFFVQEEMAKTGVDLLLDIHGEEEIPYTFLMPAKGACGVALDAKRFKEEFERITVDFQTKFDYNTYRTDSRCCQSGCGGEKQTKATDKRNVSATPNPYCGSRNANLRNLMATQYATQVYGCLAMVLEMPFIDHLTNPDENNGWSAIRSQQLGKNILTPILSHLTLVEAKLSEVV